MTTEMFTAFTDNSLSFTNISVTETNVGLVAPFTGIAPQPVGITTPTGADIDWAGMATGVYYANSSEVLNISYTVTSTSAASLIDSMGQIYQTDIDTGPGVSLTAVQTAYDRSGILLGTDTFTLGAINVASVAFQVAQTSINVHVALTLAIGAGGSNASALLISSIQNNFATIATAATASIGDIVFNDMSGTGLETGFDAGPGVAGVTVELLNATGTAVLGITTTDATGHYNFTGLTAGVYEVQFFALNGYGFSTQGVGSNSAINSSANQLTGITAPITVTAGQFNHNVEAGLVPGGSAGGSSGLIGNTVWLDSNGNGLFDTNEAGVAGVTVDLLSGTGAFIAATTTDASGSYQFTNLAAGNYEVQVLAPAGDGFTTENALTSGAVANSVVNGSGLTSVITLTSGQIDNNVNAGLTPPPASLGSTVWLDANRDGLLDNGETGVAGVTVELLNAAGTSVLATTTTNSAGTYGFTGLSAGAYEVEFLAPTGDMFTAQGVGSDPAVNSSANATTGITAPLTLTAGQNDTVVNAGLQILPASLGSTVFMDTNRDGLLDNGETGVAGVTVELLNAAGTSILATTTTSAGGTYAFTNLNPNVYEVAFIAPAGDILTTQGAGTNPAINSSANATTGITAPITLTAGQSDTVVNGGLQIAPASLGSTVWFDANGNGLLDTGEAGVIGATVELLNAAGTSILATTTTDHTGAYAFTGLNAGVYEVAFISPGGETFTTQGVGSNPAVNSSANMTTGVTAPITLTAGQIDNNVEAGLVAIPVTTAAIGNTVWLDTNHDGLDNNGENGVAGVTVELLNGAGTSILATTTTNSSGTYQFANLAAGTYEVQVLAPTGDTFTTENAAATGTVKSSAVNASGLTAVITLTTGQIDNNINAGLVPPPASLGSTVWLDANRDGLLNNSEAGVAGVTVELLNGAGTSILATTTTDSAGAYAFTGLSAGTYEVEFVAPTGDIFTDQAVGTNPAINSSAKATSGITSPITLTAGQNNPNVNAGLQIAPASLGSTVFMDTNRNGLLDNGEVGVAGVTVDLLNAAGTSVLAVTTTNASGNYSFTGLNPGAYEVKFVAPTGDIFTTQNAGTSPAFNSSANATTGITAPVTLTAGQNNPNVNAGLETLPAAIGSIVWLDTNKDGLLNNNEAGVAGVTVELLNAAGTSILATTTTNSAGGYNFTNLNAGVYEVKFLAPSGDTFTTQGVGTNGAVNSSANAATGVTAPITLTAGQIDTNVEAGLTNTSSISVLKLPSTIVVNQAGQVTYTFSVTNTGTTALNNVNITDNTGTAAHPNYIAPTLVTTGTNGILGAGQTWAYTETVTVSSGSATSTPSGSLIAPPLTTAQFVALNGSGAIYGPAASATFTDGPFTVTSGTASPLMTAPRASSANGILLVLSATSAAVAALGSQTIQISFHGQVITFSAANFATSSADGFPSNISGFGNGQVNGLSFSSTLHAGANFTYAAPLSSVGGTGTSLGAVVIASPINLRVDVFGDQNGVIIDNAANSGAEGITGIAGTGGTPTIAGAADTVTVTAQSTTGAPVSATDTKEVQVLGSNTNISVGGTATTASLSATYGAAKTLEFTYNPGNIVSLKQVQAGLGIVIGTNSNTLAFMEISNNANFAQSGASIYFQGAVTSGEKIFADATTNVLTNTPIAGGHFSTSAGTDIFAFVFSSQQAFLSGTAPIQTMVYNTSGSQAMHFGDTIGSLSVVGYIGATGGHLVS